MTEQWEELKETIIELRDNDGTGTQQEVCKFLANYIDVLEKQIIDGWIPVSERLPEEYKRVLVSDTWSGVYVGQYVDAEEKWGGKHFINEAGMHSKTVEAWQPLPERYKAESEEEE